jgi:hypothetical protein
MSGQSADGAATNDGKTRSTGTAHGRPNAEVSLVANDTETREYFALLETVSSFDQRILTIKGWGVTLSLAALGLGFQYRSYGMFLVSATSGIAFWALEAATKRHQMRHYPRIRQIEVNSYARSSEDERPFSSPRVDWSWRQAGRILRGIATSEAGPEPIKSSAAYRWSWLLPHVAMPHLITVSVGTVLFALALSGCLEGFTLGAIGK